MNIAFISTMGSAPWGGSEELWSRAAARLKRDGLEVSALVAKWPVVPEGIENLRRKQVRVDFLARPSLVRRGLSRLVGGNAGATYRKYFQKASPDIVVISQGWTGDGVACMLECAERGIPYAPIVQANSELWWPDDAIRGDWIRAYEMASRVFFVSRRNADLLEEQLGIRLPRKAFVSNPWNVRILESVSWPAAGEPTRIACVARLEIQAKGQDALLRGLAMAKANPPGFHVSFFGAGTHLAGLRSLASHLQLANVSFEGHVSDMNVIWETHHMLALPSRLEGSSLALIEAMWCGRPALVTDVGGNAELCEDNVTGFVCPAPTPLLLGETLDRAWRAASRWPAMGTAARNRIESRVPRDPVGMFCEQVMKALQ